MSLVMLAQNRDMSVWRDALLNEDSNLEIEIWPHIRSVERVQFVVCWNQPANVLNHFPNLKAVSSLGAGVDHILDDNALSKNVTICRVVSPSLLRQMQEYILSAVLNYQRNTLSYLQDKKQGIWDPKLNKAPDEFTIGFMGLGELRAPIAHKLASLGYLVNGWARSTKNISGVTTFRGVAELEVFLSQTRLLICLLPLTPETESILDLEVFKKLQHPSYLINVARGEHLVEEDLIYAIDKGWIDGACLDVFAEEPLPGRHPFWNRTNIIITPHVSSITQPHEVASQLVDNYKRALSGMELNHKVDQNKGY